MGELFDAIMPTELTSNGLTSDEVEVRDGFFRYCMGITEREGSGCTVEIDMATDTHLVAIIHKEHKQKGIPLNRHTLHGAVVCGVKVEVMGENNGMSNH